MISQEQFDKIELEHGCGYWFVCDDHACACAPTAAVSQGFNLKVYESMRRQQEKDRKNMEREMLELDKMLERYGEGQ